MKALKALKTLKTMKTMKTLLKFFCLTLLVLVCISSLACTGKRSFGPDVPQITTAVDPVWFDQMQALESGEQWDELQKMAGFVLSHTQLSDRQRAWGVYYAGRVFLEKGEGRLALAYAREAANEMPSEIRPQILLSLAEQRFGNSMRAEHILYNLLGKNPDNLDVHLALARANEISGHWPAARAWYSKVLSLKPADPALISKIALMYWLEGDAENAIAEFDKALAINPQDAAAWNDKGIIFLAQGKGKQALLAFDQAITLKPGYDDALLNRANYNASRGKYQKALADCDAGLVANPNNAKLLLARGQIYRDQGKLSHALVDFEQAYEFEKRDPHVLNELAWFLATCPRKDLRDGPRAVILAERGAISQQNPDPGIYDTLAAAYAESGRFEDAIKAQETAVHLATGAHFAPETIAIWKNRLDLYRQGKAYHD